MKAVHCYKPVERRTKLLHLLASLCTYEVLYDMKETSDDDRNTQTATAVRIVSAHLHTTNYSAEN